MVQDKRRRRKRARIADQSDSDSENVDMKSHSSSSSSEQSEQSDAHESASDHEADSDHEEHESYANARLAIHNAPAPDQDFNQYFLNLVTQQFGDELEQLRNAADFNQSSMDLLIAGLKNGANIFDPEQKKLLLTVEQ